MAARNNSETATIHIGPYWINPQHIVYCHDRPDLLEPMLHVYLRYIGGNAETAIILQGQDREAMLAWLEEQNRFPAPPRKPAEVLKVRLDV